MEIDATLTIIDQLLGRGLENENQDEDGRTVFHEAILWTS